MKEGGELLSVPFPCELLQSGGSSSVNLWQLGRFTTACRPVLGSLQYFNCLNAFPHALSFPVYISVCLFAPIFSLSLCPCRCIPEVLCDSSPSLGGRPPKETSMTFLPGPCSPQPSFLGLVRERAMALLFFSFLSLSSLCLQHFSSSWEQSQELQLVHHCPS